MVGKRKFIELSRVSTKDGVFVINRKPKPKVYMSRTDSPVKEFIKNNPHLVTTKEDYMISKNDYPDIIRMKKDVISMSKIGKIYGVSRQRIFQLCQDKPKPGPNGFSGKRPFPDLPRFFCQGLGYKKQGRGGPKKSTAVIDFIKKNPHLVTKEVTE